MSNFQHRRVTIFGLGRHGGGVAAARFLARRGARVTISDGAPAESLAESLHALRGVPIEGFSLGGHRATDFDEAELVVVNPAVRPDNPWLRQIDELGIPRTTEIELFLDHCPAFVVAVTGSNGKSTTASMIHHLLQASGVRSWLGGNIGGSLLDELPQIRADDRVVLELSSFQLARIAGLARPIEVAVILNCTPNHLDWHGDFANYRHAKQRLLDLQSPSGKALLGDATVAAWRPMVRGALLVPLHDHAIPPLKLDAPHQRFNAACAASAALAAGATEHSIAALQHFRGLPHRLQLVATYREIRFVDDSKSTTPDATRAALRAVAGPLWLLAGGDAKRADLAPLGADLVRYTAGVACFGAAGRTLWGVLRDVDAAFPCACHSTLAEALDWCWNRAARGDAIVLSPACASHDQYVDYVARAADFRAQVQRIGSVTAPGRRRSDREICSPPETPKSSRT
jgi:UDP-N-acetylmuramoylalanine--D-glutamate ligase